MRQADNPAWRKRTGEALNAVLGGMSASAASDPSGHAAAQGAVMIEVPSQPSPKRSASLGKPTLDPRFKQTADEHIARGISAGLAGIGPAVEAAVAKALAKAGGSDE